MAERMIQEAQTADAELVRRTLKSDDEAFRELVLRYQRLVFACAYAITRNHADAADAAQEAFIRLHRHLQQFDSRRPLKPYLLRIAANCSRNLVARRSRQDELAKSGPEVHPTGAAARSPERKVVQRERHEAIRQMINALPHTLREVCSLFYLGECSCKEVGAILGMGESAVKVALHRARRRLLQHGIAELRAV